jgi:hypothetical protein
MERTPTGVSLDVAEVLICGINPVEVPYHVSFAEIPGVIEGLARNVAIMRNAHAFLTKGHEDGSKIITDKVLKKSEAKIVDTSTVHDSLVRAFDEHLLGPQGSS